MTITLYIFFCVYPDMYIMKQRTNKSDVTVMSVYYIVSEIVSLKINQYYFL